MRGDIVELGAICSKCGGPLLIGLKSSGHGVSVLEVEPCRKCMGDAARLRDAIAKMFNEKGEVKE